ncbi:hypothetical protein ABEG18_10320 [Alsobacter sp. KACC 23698]|uniref:Uncharacterized protein n=1 Tax=Alsobacter sp. KACC 23698 TaxID=3149229 RepID=A0AAU7JLF1_9HYPH
MSKNPCNARLLTGAAGGLAIGLLAGHAALAQVPASTNASFEASLKQFCPAKNLEFLKPDVLAKTTDAFVRALPSDQRKRVSDLARPGAAACAGSADESCRTAALLGSIRYMDLSAPLAQKFCELSISCKDWFDCGEDRAPAAQQEASVAPPPQPAPPEPARPQQQAVAQPPASPQPRSEPPAATVPPPPAYYPPPVARAEPPAEAEPAPAPGRSAEVEAPAPVPLPPPRTAARARPELPRPDPSVADLETAARQPPARLEDDAAERAPGARGAVAGFYRALGRGDGIEAARYLIPEKRGRGPFSAAAMSRFYGGLRSPLRLEGVREIGPGTLRARYTFAARDGSVCRGDAVISVREGSSGPLIESIRALSGC